MNIFRMSSTSSKQKTPFRNFLLIFSKLCALKCTKLSPKSLTTKDDPYMLNVNQGLEICFES